MQGLAGPQAQLPGRMLTTWGSLHRCYLLRLGHSKCTAHVAAMRRKHMWWG
jgi:hypothetical protein